MELEVWAPPPPSHFLLCEGDSEEQKRWHTSHQVPGVLAVSQARPPADHGAFIPRPQPCRSAAHTGFSSPWEAGSALEHSLHVAPELSSGPGRVPRPREEKLVSEGLVLWCSHFLNLTFDSFM